MQATTKTAAPSLPSTSYNTSTVNEPPTTEHEKHTVTVTTSLKVSHSVKTTTTTQSTTKAATFPTERATTTTKFDSTKTSTTTSTIKTRTYDKLSKQFPVQTRSNAGKLDISIFIFNRSHPSSLYNHF